MQRLQTGCGHGNDAVRRVVQRGNGTACAQNGSTRSAGHAMRTAQQGSASVTAVADPLEVLSRLTSASYLHVCARQCDNEECAQCHNPKCKPAVKGCAAWCRAATCIDKHCQSCGADVCPALQPAAEDTPDEARRACAAWCSEYTVCARSNTSEVGPSSLAPHFSHRIRRRRHLIRPCAPTPFAHAVRYEGMFGLH